MRAAESIAKKRASQFDRGTTKPWPWAPEQLAAYMRAILT
jgi:hypothetical protein